MIKKHIGDKTVQNYDKGKSFHIIKINNEEKIVTLKDKKILLKQNKMKKKGITGLEDNEKPSKFLTKDEKSNDTNSTNATSSINSKNKDENADEKNNKTEKSKAKE